LNNLDVHAVGTKEERSSKLVHNGLKRALKLEKKSFDKTRLISLCQKTQTKRERGHQKKKRQWPYRDSKPKRKKIGYVRRKT